MAGNSVPVFFGAKAATRRPSAVDVTITYDHSVTNGSFIEAFRSIDNIKAMQAELAAEGVGTGADVNRFSISSFEFLMHTLHDDVPKVWIEADDLDDAGLEWADSRNVAFNGTSDEDETGAIHRLMTESRSVATLVADPVADWPRTTDSWPRDQNPQGSVVDGSYRAAAGNNIRGIIISESTEEATLDVAIFGTYGIANGPIGSDYNTDSRGPNDGIDNNTRTTELSEALDDPTLSQILVFIDTVTITCSDRNAHVTAGLIPDSTYEPIGVVFPTQTACTVIYAPYGVITSQATTYFVPNVPLDTLGGLSPDAPGTAGRTNTYHYAKKSNGAVLSLDATSSNFPDTFWALGRVLGRYLYDTSF
jgi:hypothetical protein